MRTTFMAKGHEVERKWLVVDAEGKTLGRLASEVASILRGKHKPIFTPHVDTGDHVIVINAEKINYQETNYKTKSIIVTQLRWWFKTTYCWRNDREIPNKND